MIYVNSAGAIALCAIVLAACNAGTNTSAMAPSRDGSANRIATSTARAIDDTSGYRHGAETESGIPIMVTDGTKHVLFPSSVTVARSADGLRVTHDGRILVFSATATVTQAGNYHHFASVAR